MTAILYKLRSRDKRLLSESTRTIRALDAAFNQDILAQVFSIIGQGTPGPGIRRRGRRVIQTLESPRNVVAWSIGQQIRAARERRGWRQEDLAQESGIARANIARLEKGNQIPKVATLRRVAGALGLQADALLKSPEPLADKEDQELADAGLGEWAPQLNQLDKAE